MKMKTVFLSMLAIAALASCSRQEFVDPPSPNPQEGEKMLVDITLSNGEITKAGGVATADEDKAINNVTVFFLNATDQIVSRTYVQSSDLTSDETDATKKKATVATRTTATQMMAIANIGEDRTTTGKALNVSTKEQLLNVVQDLIVSDGQQPPSMIPFQVKGNILMSGEGIVSAMASDPAGGPSTATADVTLKYIAAKITLAKIALGANVLGTYAEDFTFTRAFLLNVQTKSHYLPTANSYIPDTKEYANGVTWVPSWGSDPDYPVVADFNQPLTAIAAPGDLPKSDIAHWYVFENNPASVQPTDHPTILVVEVKWRKAVTGGGDSQQDPIYENKMFNVIFAPGDKGVIEAGKAYNVELTFNGDFRAEDQGGTGGGGDDKPDQPNINANVTVTVTPAEWTDAPTPKPF